MANLGAASSSGKIASSLEDKLLTTLPEKISCLQETVSFLNQCIDEENQGELQNDKE